jgi:murein DD-endopeptidase MepM/ murein hydrolase activator NlpD
VPPRAQRARPGSNDNEHPRRLDALDFRYSVNTSHPFARRVLRAESILEDTIGHYPRRHRVRTAAFVVAAFLGTAVTAFGVAPLTVTNVPPQPTHIVTEDVTPQALAEQLEALALHELTLYRQDLTRASDTADTLLRRLGMNDAEAAQFIRRDPVARLVIDGRAGKIVHAESEPTAAGARLSRLVVRAPSPDKSRAETHFMRITVERDVVGITARAEQVPMQMQTKVSSGTIDSTLYAAADESHIPDAVTDQLTELFGNDIDFRREVRRGDTFTVVYEALTADGEPITWSQRAGRLLSARYVNGGQVHDAVWFHDGTKGGYYDLNGRSKQKLFIASPMAFSRVTSGFAMRLHPIFRTWRAHKGVDYAAPTGTPVRTVGPGVVDFTGVQGGYGNVVVIKHPGNRETVYAHLSRIGVKRGQRVEAGDLVGAVGATGWATGPHLHFELKVGGEQVDPMTLARNSESLTISPAAAAQFRLAARTAQVQLAVADARKLAQME